MEPNVVYVNPLTYKSLVDGKIIADAQNQSEVERQVIVHCRYQWSNIQPVMRIRIWETTYLRDRDSSHKSKLLTVFNISIAPVWTEVFCGTAEFTLVFSGLPRECVHFDLFENTPTNLGFTTGLISRNKSDVYHVDIASRN